MDRRQFEHVIGAAANIVDEDEIVVVGSQAILGARPDAPEGLLRSMEVDLFPKNDPDKATEIDGAIGDGSRFHEAFGYYANGVGPETATPDGWEDRLVVVEVPPRSGSGRRPKAYCLEPHDLVLAKCAAGRERDWEFARTAVSTGIVAKDTLLSRLDDMPISSADRERISGHISAL